MKSKIMSQADRKPRPFPKLMVDMEGDVVLMSDSCTGTVVAVTEHNDPKWLGFHKESWKCMKDFHGVLELEND